MVRAQSKQFDANKPNLSGLKHVAASAADGGRVAVWLLPDMLAYPLAQLERFGLFILIGILFIVPWVTREMGVNFDIVGTLIGEPVSWLKNAIFVVTGHR